MFTRQPNYTEYQLNPQAFIQSNILSVHDVILFNYKQLYSRFYNIKRIKHGYDMFVVFNKLFESIYLYIAANKMF